MPFAKFSFHGALNFFLSRRQKNTTITHQFEWRSSIKDMIESIAPPHTEIELLIVNDKSVNWDYIVQDGDIVHAYPDFEAVDLAEKHRLIPPYQGKPKFILDTHLGRLAAYLRMMGFDTLYENDYEDDVLADISAKENRILLTRDLGVLKRGIVIYGYFVRNTNPRQRLLEISGRYNLAKFIDAFGRCMACNGNLEAVNKETIREKIPQNTFDSFDDFQQCPSCEKIFWKGSHYEKMRVLIDDVLGA